MSCGTAAVQPQTIIQRFPRMIKYSSVSIKVEPRLTLRAEAFYSKLLFCNLSFLRQSYSNLNTMHKSIPFMIPAEGADGIDNPVHFL